MRRASLPGVAAALVIGSVACPFGVRQARGSITSASYHKAETMDLTRVGTVDWCVYRVDNMAAPTFAAADWKRGGAGVERVIRIRGRVKRAEATQFTGVGWGWTDGTRLASHTHRQGTDDGMGVRAWIGKEGALVFGFAAAPPGEERQAHVIFRSDGRLTVLARQGDETRTVTSLGGGKSLGVAVVRYGGPGALTIEIVNPDGGEQAARGFAAALSGPVDYLRAVPGLPTRQELAARDAARLGEVDFLEAAVGFAECMLRYGRDRYGKVESPLFAVLLTRETKPRIGPQPYFDRPSPYDTSKMNTPFRKYDFNRCLNYPGGLGGGGPHKVTVFGCDVYEDAALYEMLIDLSRITGNARYRAEAERALEWWFKETQSPETGLYPWGEHLGWDFENECPTYFEGPSKQLYAACYHEIKDRVPFLDILAKLPPERTGGLSPLERYAIGVWDAHYWDKERAVYCRHGDYTGADDRAGSYAGFPAHQGAHLSLWAKTYSTARDAGVRRKIRHVLAKVLDVQIARAKKYGFIPFTFEPDFKGKAAKRSGQSDRLAHHAAELAITTKDADAALAAKLRELAQLLLGEEGLARAARNIEMFRATGDRAYLQGDIDRTRKPASAVADLSKAETPDEHAREIVRRLEWHRAHGDRAYLDAAVRQARLAYVRFMDGKCPLPKAYEDPRKTVAGEPFPDFYFRGARFMHAFALVGEAMRQSP
ncbi:MAG: hypothetical protein ACYS9X_01375 [Planctomycetota bacterium]|jgi:hypothetical protein